MSIQEDDGRASPRDEYSGLYLVRHWKTERQEVHRRLMSRYATLERIGHPHTRAYGRLIELNKAFIALLDAELQT